MATMPVIIRQDAPAYLTAETPTPLWDGVTNADLLGYALDLRQAARRVQCGQGGDTGRSREE